MKVITMYIVSWPPATGVGRGLGRAWGFRRRECCMIRTLPETKMVGLKMFEDCFHFGNANFHGLCWFWGILFLILVDECRWYTSFFFLGGGPVFKEHETKTHERAWETNSCERHLFAGVKNAACFPAIFPTSDHCHRSLWQVGNRQEDATVLGPVGARNTQTMGAEKQEMRSTDKDFLRFS